MIEVIRYKSNQHTIEAIDQRCNRCLGNQLAIRENNHLYCDECSRTQSMSDFLFLERFHRSREKRKHQLKISFELSKSQRIGEQFVNDCYQDNASGFLHAVCGAGKTEMCLKAMYLSLTRHQSIVFVIPRVEIIKQIVVRFQLYFPKSKVVGLYQNVIFDEDADIYVATPHQMIKFYQEFDLMIVDEADAYPFYQNQYLYRLIKKALNPNGTLIYISATMPKDYQEMIEKSGWRYCLIPERFHSKDLILPMFKKYQYLYNDRLLSDIASYHQNQNKLLVFFPSIGLMNRYEKFLLAKGIVVRTIASSTKFKPEVIRGFVHGDYFILLSTTILERGVTFNQCDVFVIETDHSIFDKETLIQIAGRVGRSKTFTSGHLVFYSRYMTSAMVDAKNELEKLNRLKNHDMQTMS